MNFMEGKPHLVNLSDFMKLKMSDLVANHIYFEGLSPSKVTYVSSSNLFRNFFVLRFLL